MVIAIVNGRCRNAIDKAGELGDWIIRLLRIGDMALRAFDRHFKAEGTATANLDCVAQRFNATWLTNQAMVGHMAIGLHPLQHLDGAVDGRAFFIAGDEEGD